MDWALNNLHIHYANRLLLLELHGKIHFYILIYSEHIYYTLIFEKGPESDTLILSRTTDPYGINSIQLNMLPCCLSLENIDCIHCRGV